MTKREEKSNMKVWLVVASVLVVVALCVVGMVLLLRGSETRETGSKETYAISALTCTTRSAEDAFFSLDSAISSEHTIKMTFKDEKPDKVSYSYVGEFSTAELAEKASSSYHANYNVDMGGNKMNPEKLTPAFVATDKTVKINLYSAVNELNATTAKFFFLTADEQRNLSTYSEKTIQKIYENVGFKCEYNNQSK
ncbi:hypothetical protein IJH06_01585 [Candidatus Saccharibacteria bacterium]|nr:hypothetical protein [Candidatus Saccharibacteria bacterium]